MRADVLLRITCCFLFAFMIASQTAAAAARKPAVDPVRHSENYAAVLYNNTNGLPISEANDIAQTSEGFIWIASYAGLIRYDGNTFERRDNLPAMKSVASLFVDSRDRLWVGSNDSGVVMLAKGDVHSWDEESGLASD